MKRLPYQIIFVKIYFCRTGIAFIKVLCYILTGLILGVQ